MKTIKTFPPELSECPCGQTPTKLVLSDNGSKWAYASGNCCNEWHIEFRTFYNELDTDTCMNLAIEAWNGATRKIHQPKLDPTFWICPNCQQENMPQYSACWNCLTSR